MSRSETKQAATRRSRKGAPEPSLPFAGPIEGYVVNYLCREEWKVSSSMERRELISEAWLVWHKIADRYPGVEAPHFMALFKTAWHRRFLTLAAQDSGARRTFIPMAARADDDGDELEVLEPPGETENEGVMLAMLRQAPREVAMVLQLFLSAPQELLETALASWQGPKEHRSDGGSLRINQLLGFEPSFDSVGAVREYFASCAS
jgi:hypothetical protein